MIAARTSACSSIVAPWRMVWHLMRRRVRRDPVPRDVDAARDPHLVVPLDVVEEARAAPASASRPADQPAVQADRHHLRRVVAVRIAFA